jgi:hypothetical protein
LAGLVQPYRVAKREVVRPEHPDAFVHRPETNAVNLSTERSTCGSPVVHFRRKIVIARVRRLALAIGGERLIKRGTRASKIVEDLERDSRSRHGHSPCRPSKRRDRPCLQPAPRATNPARQEAWRDWSRLSRPLVSIETRNNLQSRLEPSLCGGMRHPVQAL